MKETDERTDLAIVPSNIKPKQVGTLNIVLPNLAACSRDGFGRVGREVSATNFAIFFLLIRLNKDEPNNPQPIIKIFFIFSILP